jgi:hypothetical protein
MNLFFTSYFYRSKFVTFLSTIICLLPIHAKREWVGKNPSELAPDSRPLGSMNEKFFNIKKTNQDSLNTNKVSSFNKKKTERGDHTSKKNSQVAESSSTSDHQQSTKVKNQSNKNWVGSTPLQLVPHSIPLGSMKNRFHQTLNARSFIQDEKTGSLKDSKNKAVEQNLPIELSLFSSSRFYSTTNVLRTKEDEVKSTVLENTIGTSITSKPIPTGQYITLVPKLDLIMQWANYDESSVNDLLDYRFGMAKGSIDMYLPQDFRVSPSLEYDFLHSQFSGDKLFDAVAPSLSVQKIMGLNKTTFLLLDGMLKYSKTKRVITFPTDNIFPDDGDNLQLGLNLNLMKSFGENGNFIIMPGLGLSRTEYLRNNQDGRVDVLVFAGISGIFQPFNWLSLQSFYNFTTMTTNQTGKKLLGKSSSFQAWDIGCSITASHTF